MQRELDGLKQSADEAIAKAARAANRVIAQVRVRVYPNPDPNPNPNPKPNPKPKPNRVIAQGAERGGELRERGQAGEPPAYSLLTHYLRLLTTFYHYSPPIHLRFAHRAQVGESWLLLEEERLDGGGEAHLAQDEHLPTSPHISPHLPISPPHLPCTSRRTSASSPSRSASRRRARRSTAATGCPMPPRTTSSPYPYPYPHPYPYPYP